MAMKDTLIEKLQNQINAWEKQAEEQKAEAERKRAEAENEEAGARLQQQIMDRVHGLENNISEARRKLNDLQKVGEEQAAQMKQQIQDILSR